MHHHPGSPVGDRRHRDVPGVELRSYLLVCELDGRLVVLVLAGREGKPPLDLEAFMETHVASPLGRRGEQLEMVSVLNEASCSECGRGIARTETLMITRDWEAPHQGSA